MKRVITYGTFDLLHEGHVNLLRRARELGDYLVVGVTSSDFDASRGKINVRQSLMDRIEAVQSTGLADEVIPEEYVGQKIDDIINYRIDIFAIGSDWEGQFDYLKEYCQVVYLERTPGISSTQLRNEGMLRLGVIGKSSDVTKFIHESMYVCGIEVCGQYSSDDETEIPGVKRLESISALFDECDAVYVANNPADRFFTSKSALQLGKHVLCESPVSLSRVESEQLFSIARSSGLVFQEAIKTAYALAYKRLLLMVKSGRIGEVVSVRSACTSMARSNSSGALLGWGPIACLPIFDLLGTNYRFVRAASRVDRSCCDTYTNFDFVFDSACASFEVGYGAKTEGELVIAGTKGYVVVPSPWWKPDYFEIRFEDFSENKKFFFQLNGEGIRHEILEFIQVIEGDRRPNLIISPEHTAAFCELIDCYRRGSIPVYQLGGKLN